jgi:DNA-binding winged helix-turn-helix (wHTH) protein/tetratricopeptide (TPR) repeat protein
MRTVTFGPYRLDLDRGELYRSDVAVKLQPQPAKLLVLLVDHAGELVTRDEIRRSMWGTDTFVDFDQSVNFCIRQIRTALHDNADTPCYVETLPRRGYRFIAPVERIPERLNAGPVFQNSAPLRAPRHLMSRRLAIVLAVLMITAATFATGAFRHSRLRASRTRCNANQELELGRFFLNKYNQTDTMTAAEHFQAATKEDPNCAAAYAGIADAYNQMASVYIAGKAPANVRLLAFRAATQAIQLDPTLAEGYEALGYTTLHELDWSQSEKALRRALELNPRYTRAHLTYATYLAAQRRFKDAVAEARDAVEIEPVSLRVRQVFGWMLYFDRQYDAAIRELQKIVEMDRNFAVAQFHLGEALLVVGRFEEAISTLRTVVDLTEHAPAPLGLLAMAYAGAHQREEAQRILADLQKRSLTETVPPGALLLGYMAVDDKQRAIDMLERGYAERDNYEIWIVADPLMDPLRNEPRYQAVCRQVMLGAASRTTERLQSNASLPRR